MSVFEKLRGLFGAEGWGSRPTVTMWRAAAEACGLRPMTSGAILTRTLEASSDSFRVQFNELRGAELSTEIKVTVEGALPIQLGAQPAAGPRLFPESRSTVVMKRQGAVELELGDMAFDDQFFVGGEPAELFARLDAATRRDLLAVNRQSNLYIARGELRLSCDEQRLEAPLKNLLAVLLRIAQRLFGPLDLAEALAQNARSESAPVRLQNLLTLVREYPSDVRTKPALRAALGDAVPEIRLRAAQALGAEGLPVLNQLAADEEIADECSAAAISALGSRFEMGQLEIVLAASLQGGRLETVLACVAVLGNHSDQRAAAHLFDLLGRGTYRIPAAAARALGRGKPPGSEEALIEALDGDSEDLRLAAVETLGDMGSAASVIPLRGVAGARDLERAARQSIAKIQSRAAGASPGQLSLAAGAAGRLSLAPGEAGGLSLASPSRGGVSLPPAVALVKPAHP